MRKWSDAADEFPWWPQCFSARVRLSNDGVSLATSVFDADALCLLLDRVGDLVSFRCSNTGLSDQGLAFIAGQTHLRTLDLRSTRVTGWGLWVLRMLPRLRKLSCSIRSHVREGVGHISRARSLKVVSLDGSRLGGRDLSPLQRLKRLERLSLRDSDAAEGLEYLASCSRLTILRLDGTHAGDEVPRALAGLPLRELRLGRTRVTDAGVRELVRCRTLETLTLNETAVTAAGLRSVQELPNLHTLALWGVKVDEEVAEVLSGMRCLRALHLEDPECPSVLRERLAADLPLCRMDWLDV